MKNKKSTLRQLNDWLHLWLGLVSGLVVFIVSITGCIYVYHDEIERALGSEPWKYVEVQNKEYIPPSVVLETAMAQMPDSKPTGLTYANRDGAAAVGFSSFTDGKRSFTAVFVNPYTGEFIKKQKFLGKDHFNFFRFILDGHRALWLPYDIGRPIVGVCTLIFLFLLVSGLIMWWPKNLKKSNLNKSFKIKWKGTFKRVNYDLHNVLGFYSLLLAFVIAVTGLVWSFEWFEDGLYYVTSAGDSKPGHHHPHSDTTQIDTATDSVSVLDLAWYKVMAEEKNQMAGMYMTPLMEDPDDAIEIIAYQDEGSWFNRNIYYYDQYTLERFRVQGDRFDEANFADQLDMLNLDLHMGSALGLTGKTIAFFISLICGSLPITGLIVWLNKKKAPGKKKKASKASKKGKLEIRENLEEQLV
ncbi:PepSY-associated TM helix domain-containing protein [Reichenbachiella agariperforans]|uniref:PepSY-associated TM helix domain-containing protein n=1 Tax=Reichenbachiella agariperforans TaxID=156994 RepID=UPI001C083EE9|nr:PepSY-associated TM helix domain-containing protein [Reichenbachiella agariperforans]MBU2914713.1 PepSY domain-containing protein [Reichenbachiella agariperforans]